MIKRPCYINGIDVSSCILLEKRLWCTGSMVGDFCKDNPDCYFKQWEQTKGILEKTKVELAAERMASEVINKKYQENLKKLYQLEKKNKNEE